MHDIKRPYSSFNTQRIDHIYQDPHIPSPLMVLHYFLIATGMQYSVRQFIEWSAAELGITLRFEGQGVNEHAVVAAIAGEALKMGDVIVRVPPRYFRPAEVETLLDDPTKAKQKLGWVPEITVQEMCAEMVAEDLKVAERHALLRAHRHDLAVSRENN